MASTKADNNREAWTYISDTNDEFLISSKTVYTSDVTDGAKYGGHQANGQEVPLPRQFRPRAVKCTDATGFAIWVTAYANDATIVTAGTTVTRNKNGTDTEFTSTGKMRRELDRRRSITQQS